MLNAPSAAEMALIDFPFTEMVAPATGLPSLSRRVPFTGDCAIAEKLPSNIKMTASTGIHLVIKTGPFLHFFI